MYISDLAGIPFKICKKLIIKKNIKIQIKKEVYEDVDRLDRDQNKITIII